MTRKNTFLSLRCPECSPVCLVRIWQLWRLPKKLLNRPSMQHSQLPLIGSCWPNGSKERAGQTIWAVQPKWFNAFIQLQLQVTKYEIVVYFRWMFIEHYWTIYIYIVFYFTILMMMYFQLLQSFMVKEDWNLRTLALAIQLDSKGNVTWPSRLVVFFGELPLFHIGDSCVFNI